MANENFIFVDYNLYETFVTFLVICITCADVYRITL